MIYKARIIVLKSIRGQRCSSVKIGVAKFEFRILQVATSLILGCVHMAADSLLKTSMWQVEAS